jgi:hypothetical protein
MTRTGLKGTVRSIRALGRAIHSNSVSLRKAKEFGFVNEEETSHRAATTHTRCDETKPFDVDKAASQSPTKHASDKRAHFVRTHRRPQSLARRPRCCPTAARIGAANERVGRFQRSSISMQTREAARLLLHMRHRCDAGAERHRSCMRGPGFVVCSASAAKRRGFVQGGDDLRFGRTPKERRAYLCMATTTSST